MQPAATAADVAAYITRKLGSKPPAKKRLKLCYYAQAWSMAWYGEPLFAETIEAWRDGPVVRAIWDSPHSSPRPEGNADAVPEPHRGTIDAVLAMYGDLTGDDLSTLTHLERPWLDARGGLRAGASSRNPISPAALAAYYGRGGFTPGSFPAGFREGLRALLEATDEDAEALAALNDDDELGPPITADDIAAWSAHS